MQPTLRRSRQVDKSTIMQCGSTVSAICVLPAKGTTSQNSLMLVRVHYLWTIAIERNLVAACGLQDCRCVTSIQCGNTIAHARQFYSPVDLAVVVFVLV
eukprot:1521973-Amphidinium_carterae.1